jgi:hypothetical protein
MIPRALRNRDRGTAGRSAVSGGRRLVPAGAWASLAVFLAGAGIMWALQAYGRPFATDGARFQRHSSEDMNMRFKFFVEPALYVFIAGGLATAFRGGRAGAPIPPCMAGKDRTP